MSLQSNNSAAYPTFSPLSAYSNALRGHNNDSAKRTINTAFIELGSCYGRSNNYVESVIDVYKKHNPQGHVQFVASGYEDLSQRDKSYVELDIKNSKSAWDKFTDFLGDGNHFRKRNQTNSANHTIELDSKSDLDKFIDYKSSIAPNIMADRINDIVKKNKENNTQIITTTIESSRDTVNEELLKALKDHPDWATHIGLEASDITTPIFRVGLFLTPLAGLSLVPSKVINAVENAVKQRMDQPGSAAEKSLIRYKDATKKAAEHGVSVVVPAGLPGGGTNFLAQSDDVISVAPIDGKGAAAKVASSPSDGDGSFPPTVAAPVANVVTPSRITIERGARFVKPPQVGVPKQQVATPQAAAVIALMLEENPTLTVAERKTILQKTATPSTQAAGVINPDQAVQQAKKELKQPG